MTCWFVKAHFKYTWATYIHGRELNISDFIKNAFNIGFQLHSHELISFSLSVMLNTAVGLQADSTLSASWSDLHWKSQGYKKARTCAIILLLVTWSNPNFWDVYVRVDCKKVFEVGQILIILSIFWLIFWGNCYKANTLPKNMICYLLLQSRFLLSKVNPSQTHNNMYGFGQVSKVLYPLIVYWFVVLSNRFTVIARAAHSILVESFSDAPFSIALFSLTAYNLWNCRYN